MTEIEEALKQERREIARMLFAEAKMHDEAAEDLRAHYDRAEIHEEAWDHDSSAAMLTEWAHRILARTPTVAVEEAPELVF